MNLDKLSFCTDTVPIWDKNGIKLDEIKLNTNVTPIPTRRTSIGENGLYYKGAGSFYQCHIVSEIKDSELKLLLETDSPYDRYAVVYPKLARKFGIFNFRHQPCFSDYDGGCGLKEQNILRMQKIFEYSAIEEIVDVIDTPIPEHYVYSFRMKDVKGGYSDTINLIEYILVNDFNTAWDKNLWSDIYCFGYVRDIADWFISDQFKHKLGTVYAMLFGISNSEKYIYSSIVSELTDLVQLPPSNILYICALIVQKFAPECVSVDLSAPSDELNYYLYNELYSGKACCHLEADEEWDFVRDYYKQKIPAAVKLASTERLRVQISNISYFL